MFFKKKKEEPAAPQQVRLQGDLHYEMYQTLLGTLKIALSQPNCTMTPEQLLKKICPKNMFSDEERAQMLKEALEQ